MGLGVKQSFFTVELTPENGLGFNHFFQFFCHFFYFFSFIFQFFFNFCSFFFSIFYVCKSFFINLFLITPITMINTARLLVENYRNGNTKYLDDITWHIVININPDGYEYTWTGSRFFKILIKNLNQN